MPQSLSFLFKRSFEFVPAKELYSLPTLMRGLYVLYHKGEHKTMNVVYVGMARGEKSGARGRLEKHFAQKNELWTHCSVYEVWDNITKEQVAELEALFRHIYRRDSEANKLNIQKSSKLYDQLRTKTTREQRSAA